MTNDEEMQIDPSAGNNKNLAADEIEVSETSPLLTNHEAQGEFSHEAILPDPGTTFFFAPFVKRYILKSWFYVKQNAYTAIPISLIAFLVLTIFVTIVLKTESVYEEATNLVISSVEITSISPTGFHLDFNGTVSFNYSDINWFYKTIYYPITFILGPISITATYPIEFFVKFNDIFDPKYYNPVNAKIPNVLLDLSSNSINSYQFPVDIDINAFDAVRTYQDFLYCKGVQEKIDINVRLKTSFGIQKYFSLGQYSAEIERVFTIDNNMESIKPKIESFSISPTKDTIRSEISIRIDPLTILVQLDISTVEWDFFILGCEANMLYLGTSVTNNITIDTLNGFQIKAKTIVPGMTKKLTKFCEDGISPINRFLNKAMNERSNIFIRARKDSLINERLPKWLHIFLSKTFQPIPVSLKDFIDDEDSDIDYSIDDGKLVIANDKEILPRASSDIKVSLNSLPFNNGAQSLFQIDSFMGDICFLYHDEIFLKVYINSWQKVETNNTDLNFQIKDSELDIINDAIFAELINRYLNGHKIEVKGKFLFDIFAKTPVFDTVFQRVEHDFSIKIEGKKDLFQALNFKLGDLSYIKTSTSTKLKVLVEAIFLNVFNVGVNFQYFNFNLSYNNTAIGSATFTDTSVSSSEESSVEPIIHFNTDQDESKTEIETLVSNYISNETVSLIVSGHENSSKVLPLANVLSRLSIPIEIPRFVSSEGEGFLIDCTFYLLKSEVEFDLYNPLNNENIQLEIKDAKVFHNDINIAYIKDSPKLILPPGLSKTQRIPVVIEKSALKDLQKAINGNLDISTVVKFDLLIDKIQLNLIYEGTGAKADIKW